MKKLFFLLVITFTYYIAPSQANKNYVQTKLESIENSKETGANDSLTLIFTGDIMQHDLQIESAYYSNTGKYDFNSQFKHIVPLFKKADAVVANLEVTLSGPPYKGYPRFSSPDALALAIKKAGIKYLALANNHMADYGKKGLERTLSVLDSLKFVRTGAYYDQADKNRHHPMVINQNNFKIAVFNYTYGLNGNVVTEPNIINLINKVSIDNDLTKAKGKYDAIVVFFHWGKEYEHVPNAKQKMLAEFCFDRGVDVVIGSHPHVIQPFKYYKHKMPNGNEKNVFVAYSLGNYVSNYATWRYCDGGSLAEFTFVKDENGVRVVNPYYHLVWVYRPVRSGKLRKYQVLPVKKFEKDYSIKGKYRQLFNRFIKDSRTHLDSANVNVGEGKF